MKQTAQIPTEAKKVLKSLFPDSEAVFNKAAEIMILKSDRCLCEVPVARFILEYLVRININVKDAKM